MYEPVYLTEDGIKRIEDELHELVHVRRAEVAALIRDAKEAGDVSENAAYDEAKDQQAFVEGRIQHLEELLKRAKLIEAPNGTERVAIGTTVVVTEGDGPAEEYQIVGSAESSPAEGRISNESPLGRALLGKRVGEIASYQTPDGETLSFEVVEIK